jgi:hypothetical protein
MRCGGCKPQVELPPFRRQPVRNPAGQPIRRIVPVAVGLGNDLQKQDHCPRLPDADQWQALILRIQQIEQALFEFRLRGVRQAA